ncbi:hypothetical protein GCM10028819_39530 [Spirosoma humi]
MVVECGGLNRMNRLSLADLKAKANVVANVEAIKGGAAEACHLGSCGDATMPADGTRVAPKGKSI